MKVALALEFFHQAGGVERRTSMLARELIKAGDEVHVLTRRWPRDAPRNLSFHRIRIRTFIRFLKPLVFAYKAELAGRRIQADTLHSQTRMFGFDVATLGVGCHRAYMQARAEPGQPAKADLYDRVTLWMERKMLSSLDGRAIITNSDMTRRHIMQYYSVPEDRITVVYNGVDVDAVPAAADTEVRESIRQEFGIAGNACVVLFVGTGFRRKGLQDVIRAIGRLSQADVKNVRVVVVGSGDAGEYLKLSRAIGLEHDPVFTGRRDDVLDFYAASDIYLLPTLYDPFSNSTMEALAAGLPVITTGMNGVSEILSNGQSGFVVGSRSSESIARALETLINDTDLRRSIGAAGKAAVQAFTWKRMTEETRAVYERVLYSRGAL